MSTSGDVVRKFYDAVVRRDFAAARAYLHDQLVFVGLFETYPDPESYLKTLEGLMGITTRLEIRMVIGEGDQAVVFFDLVARAPAEATTLVAEWHELREGRIARVHSAFDGRPFEALFSGSPPPRA